MYYIDLKKWNGQWEKPKIIKYIRGKISRMTEHYKGTVMVNGDGSDIQAIQFDEIMAGFPENRVKSQGPTAPLAYHRKGAQELPFPSIRNIPLLKTLTLLAKFKTDENDHADKHEWRERKGWASAEEATFTLSGKDGARFEVIDKL
jgi:hypothetical protein